MTELGLAFAWIGRNPETALLVGAVAVIYVLKAVGIWPRGTSGANDGGGWWDDGCDGGDGGD